MNSAAILGAAGAICLAMWCTVQSKPALAEAMPARAPSGAALVAYTVPVVPWTFPDKPATGIAPEFLRHLFTSAAIDVRLDTLPYVRAVNGLRDGSNVAALLIPDAERDTFALRLCEITRIHSGIAYKKSRFFIRSLRDLQGLTVGVQRGTRALSKLEQYPTISRHFLESIEQGVRMMQLDRLDATFMSSPGVEGVFQSNGLSKDDYGWLEIDDAPVVVYMSRKSPLAQDPAAVARLRHACETTGPGVMKTLLAKYR